GAGMGLHRRPEFAGFLLKAYETLQFKANETASSAHKINAVRVVQAGLNSMEVVLAFRWTTNPRCAARALEALQAIRFRTDKGPPAAMKPWAG
ncbi:RNA recognition motif domain-containing protein, partial [Paracoccus aerius]